MGNHRPSSLRSRRGCAAPRWRSALPAAAGAAKRLTASARRRRGPCSGFRSRLWVAGSLILAVTATQVRAQQVLDAAAVPSLDAAGRAAYAAFLATNLPRAFAVDGHGAFGSHGGSGTLEAARAQALERCAAKAAATAARDCKVYAEDLAVVWGGPAARPAPPPGPFISTWNYSLVPDERYFWRGPAAAAGVYVWAHGSGVLSDPRGAQPQAHVRAFNNAGYDVVRFDREPNADTRDRAAGWLEEGLAELRRRGYRRIVAGGQSRGAWNGLQMLQHPGLADAVVAVSPAAHGTGGSTNLTAQYDDLRALVAAVPPSSARLAFVQFQGDTFAGDLAGRAALIERLRPRLGALLVLDRPEGLTGHQAGHSPAFAARYGACLLRFVTEAKPPGGC